ncbi:MAG: hypothetical protein IK065_03625 [Neisseriaceae bacterium]|nr:hypothetical protein [Neisseriaceae bacterium]
MKTKYKVLVVYLITTYLLFIFLLYPPFSKVEYQEIVISEHVEVTKGIRGGAVFIKDANNIVYRTTCHRMNNGELVKFGRNYYKNFCVHISNTLYKKITSIYAVNVKKTKELFVKQIDYIDVDGNNVSFKIPENLFNRYIKEYFIFDVYIFRLFFILIYIITPIYFYRKKILVLFKSFLIK